MWRFNCFSREKSENKEILERASAVLTRARLIDIESALVSKRWLYLRPLAHFWTQSCGRVKVIRIRQCWLNKHFTAGLWTFGLGGRTYFLFTFTSYRFLFCLQPSLYTKMSISQRACGIMDWVKADIFISLSLSSLSQLSTTKYKKN